MQVKNEDTINRILDCINNYLLEYNEQPNIQIIADTVGVSIATVSRYVNTLIERGELTRNGRYYNLSTNKSNKIMKGIRQVALVGDIACGTPILAEENIEGYIAVSADYLGQGNFFALRAKGDSMLEAGVNDGDVVICRQQNTANEGQIVVALIENSEATLKRYYIDKKRKQIRLHPENSSMADMFFSSVDIQGVAVKVIKDLS